MIKLSSSGALFAIAKESTSVERRSQPLVAIVFAVAAVEGWLNELLEEASEHPQSATLGQLSGAAAELSGRNVSIALKLQVCFALVAGKPLDRGAQPYQDFDLLLGIRNALVHMRSETLQYGPSGTVERVQHALAKRLVARKVIDARDNAMLPLVSAIGMPGVARWAYQSAIAVVNALVEAMGDGDEKMSMRLRAGLVSPDEFNESVT